MHSNMRKTFVLLCLLIISSSAISAGIYKWKDAEGNIHYGDRPTKSSEEIKIKPGPTPDKNHNERMDKTERLLNVMDEEREAKKSDRALLAEQKAKKKEQCATAKSDLVKYKTAGYLYKLDDQGKRVILEDEEHAKALTKAQGNVNQWCG